MASVSVYNMEGKEVGNMDLSDEVFGVQINENLVHQAVLKQLADNRQGTQKAKTRSEVSGGEESPGSRREPDMPVRDRPGLPSGHTVELYSHPFPEIIHSR